MRSMLAAVLVAVLAFPASPQALTPAPKVDLAAAADAKGVLLRWNFTGAPYPAGGFHLYRTETGAKQPVKVTPQPIRRTPPAEASALLGRAIKPHVAKPGVVPPETQRARDAAVALRAQTDVKFARAYGLYVEDGAVKAGVEATYELRALDAQGKETTWAFSKPVVAGRPSPLPAPALKAPELARDAVLIRWTPLDATATRVSGYKVLRDGKPLTEQPVIVGKDPDDPDPAEGLYRDRTVKHGETYAYAVLAVDAFGRESAPAAAAPLTWKDTTPPMRPAPVAIEHLPGGPVRLRWPRPKDADLAGYHVYRVVPGAAPRRVNGAAIPASTLTFDDPAAGAEGTYVVSSVDAAGNESAIFQKVTTDAGQLVDRLRGAVPFKAPDVTPPASPAGLKAEAGKDGAVTITWTANGEKDLRQYAVWKSAEPQGPWVRVADVKEPRFSETIIAPFGGDWFYRVAAIDASDNASPQTAPATVKIPAKFPIKLPPPGGVKPPVKTIPATAKVTVNAAAKTIDFSGYSITLDALPPAAGKAAGKLKIPYFDADVKISAEFEAGKLKSVELATAKETVTWAAMGVTLELTEIDFAPSAVYGHLLQISGKASIGAPAKASMTNIALDDLPISPDGHVSSTVGGRGLSLKLGTFDFDVEQLKFDALNGAKFVTVYANFSVTDDFAACRTKVSLRPNGAIDVEQITLDFETNGVGVKGKVRLNPAQTGFSGDAKLGLGPLGFEVEVKVDLGKSAAGKPYLGIYGVVDLPGGIPIAQSGLLLTEFGGGLALGMEATYDERTDKVSFKAKDGAWAFMANLKVASVDGEVLKGSFKLSISSRRGFELTGDATLLKKAKISAEIRIGPDGLLISTDFDIDFKPIASGHGEIEIFFGKGRNNWHLFIGTKEDPISGDVLGVLRGSFYFQIKPVGGAVEIRCGISQDFDTGRCEAWIFYGRAELHFRAELMIRTDLTCELEFFAKGGVEAGACVEDWGCVDFSLRCRAHLKGRISPAGVSIRGSFRVGADLPIIGYESVSLSF